MDTVLSILFFNTFHQNNPLFSLCVAEMLWSSKLLRLVKLPPRWLLCSRLLLQNRHYRLWFASHEQQHQDLHRGTIYGKRCWFNPSREHFLAIKARFYSNLQTIFQKFSYMVSNNYKFMAVFFTQNRMLYLRLHLFAIVSVVNVYISQIHTHYPLR